MKYDINSHGFCPVCEMKIEIPKCAPDSPYIFCPVCESEIKMPFSLKNTSGGKKIAVLSAVISISTLAFFIFSVTGLLGSIFDKSTLDFICVSSIACVFGGFFSILLGAVAIGIIKKTSNHGNGYYQAAIGIMLGICVILIGIIILSILLLMAIEGM